MIEETYSNAALGRTDVFKWHKLFRVDEDERFGRSSTNKIDKNVSQVKSVKNLENSDRRMS